MLVEKVRAAGGICVKNTGEGAKGIPDRLCVLRRGRTVWVELKTPGKRPAPMQVRWIAALAAMGHIAVVVDSLDALDRFEEAFLR